MRGGGIIVHVNPEKIVNIIPGGDGAEQTNRIVDKIAERNEKQ